MAHVVKSDGKYGLGFIEFAFFVFLMVAVFLTKNDGTQSETEVIQTEMTEQDLPFNRRHG